MPSNAVYQDRDVEALRGALTERAADPHLLSDQTFKTSCRLRRARRGSLAADIDKTQAIDIGERPNAAVAALFHAASPETFSAVCEALVDAADADSLPFPDVADRAQNLATACGLVRTIGQDAVQAIMAGAFGRCRVHHRPSTEPRQMAAEPPKHHRAAESTVDALIFSLREQGTAALLDRACRTRLADLSSDQVRRAIERLIVLRPHYPNITDDLLFKLGEQL